MRLSGSLATKRRERVAAKGGMESRENVRPECVVNQGENVTDGNTHRRWEGKGIRAPR